MEKVKTINKYFAFLNRVYTNYYTLPDLDINDKEWDALFEVIYKYTIFKNQEEFYYGYLYTLTIEVLNKAFIKQNKFITLGNFIENIDILSYFGFNEEEIKQIKEEITTKASYGKLINLSDYRKRA